MLASLLAAAAITAAAQNYPVRPIRVIVPSSGGGRTEAHIQAD